VSPFGAQVHPRADYKYRVTRSCKPVPPWQGSGGCPGRAGGSNREPAPTRIGQGLPERRYVSTPGVRYQIHQATMGTRDRCDRWPCQLPPGRALSGEEREWWGRKTYPAVRTPFSSLMSWASEISENGSVLSVIGRPTFSDCDRGTDQAPPVGAVRRGAEPSGDLADADGG